MDDLANFILLMDKDDGESVKKTEARRREGGRWITRHLKALSGMLITLRRTVLQPAHCQDQQFYRDINSIRL